MPDFSKAKIITEGGKKLGWSMKQAGQETSTGGKNKKAKMSPQQLAVHQEQVYKGLEERGLPTEWYGFGRGNLELVCGLIEALSGKSMKPQKVVDGLRQVGYSGQGEVPVNVLQTLLQKGIEETDTVDELAEIIEKHIGRIRTGENNATLIESEKGQRKLKEASEERLTEDVGGPNLNRTDKLHGILTIPVMPLVKACEPCDHVHLAQQALGTINKWLKGEIGGGSANSDEWSEHKEMWTSGRVPYQLTVDEAAAIHLYTMPSEFYGEINAALRKDVGPHLEPWLPYLRLLLSACEKIPKKQGVFRRGVGVKVAQLQPIGIYKPKNSLTLWTITSTTCEHTPSFGASSGTAYTFHVQNAVDVRAFSAFKASEGEHFVFPGTELVVLGVEENKSGGDKVHVAEIHNPFGHGFA